MSETKPVATDMIEVVQWFSGGDTGSSSKAIATHMTTGKCDGSYPLDPADLGRCLRLLDRFPEWTSRIPEMGKYGAVWKRYARRWGEMSTCMAEEVGIDWSKGERAPLTYKLMHDIAGE